MYEAPQKAPTNADKKAASKIPSFIPKFSLSASVHLIFFSKFSFIIDSSLFASTKKSPNKPKQKRPRTK